VEEAVVRIREAHPDAVTVNEACRGDVALIARRTGHKLRFSSVMYQGKPYPASLRVAADSSVTPC
jgi:hypothetical protein